MIKRWVKCSYDKREGDIMTGRVETQQTLLVKKNGEQVKQKALHLRCKGLVGCTELVR